MGKRAIHYASSACYLKINDQVLMLKYNKKWGSVWTPPGGKVEDFESPLDCIMREYQEETGLTLIHPKLQGYSYWYDDVQGVIYFFTAEEAVGELKESEEGHLEWIPISEFEELNQFPQNQLFTEYLFTDKCFEAKVELEPKSCKVLSFRVKAI